MVDKLNPDYIQFVELHDPYKFDQRFIEKTKKAETYEEAYLEVEKEYKLVFRKNKYSNYESYRKARERRIKNLTK